MDEERDVEVFERIPWESLEEGPDRRWLAYLVAGVVVLGAVGISLGRQMGSGVQSAPSMSVPTTAPPASSTITSTTVAVASVPAPAGGWSEADLMALPAESVETGAMATAEWYTIDFFTRDSPEGDRSFVEWARAAGVEWQSPSTAEVTVLVRRLAATEGGPYQRLDAEAWRIGVELDDSGWSVLGAPEREESPVLEVRSPPEGERETGSAAAAQWVDPAGLTWRVRVPPEEDS